MVGVGKGEAGKGEGEGEKEGNRLLVAGVGVGLKVGVWLEVMDRPKGLAAEEEEERGFWKGVEEGKAGVGAVGCVNRLLLEEEEVRPKGLVLVGGWVVGKGEGSPKGLVELGWEVPKDGVEGW